MKCAIYYDPLDIRLEDRPDPIPGARDVVVKNVRAGICGTDLTAYLYDGTPVSIFPGNEFGHEMVGLVDAVGSEVTDIHVGDRVFVNPTTCKLDGMAHCDMAGAFSPYVRVENARYDYNLYRLPDSVGWDEAVLIEPFSVGAHGKNMANTRPGDHVVIFGAGTIGFCALSALHGMGIRDAVIVDVNPQRLRMAKKLGAAVYDANDGDLPGFLTAHFGASASHVGYPVPDVDVFIDCAGAPNITNQYLSMAKPGSRLCVVAVYKAPDQVNLAGIMASEATVIGSCGYTHEDIKEVIGYLADHSTKIDQIVTHHFPHDQISEGFRTSADPSTGAVKVVLDYE